MEDPGIDGSTVLRWIFRKWDVGVWAGSSWLRIGTVYTGFGWETLGKETTWKTQA